jgi:hypothetical protein
MKRKTSLVTLGMLLSVLLGVSLVGVKPGNAQTGFDCELDRFNAFMNADNQYTTTFQSWYFNQPVSCATECVTQCPGLSGSPLQTCLGNCIASCENSRFTAFMGAQDALIAAATRTCEYNPDFCHTARYTFDQCQFTFNSQMENPVLAENGDIDGIWADAVYTEYMACRTASGIDYCQ